MRDKGRHEITGTVVVIAAARRLQRAYHLARLAARRRARERNGADFRLELHAAGAFHALNSDTAMSRLQAYTIGLYPELQRRVGQDIGSTTPASQCCPNARPLRTCCARTWRATKHSASIRAGGPAEIREALPDHGYAQRVRRDLLIRLKATRPVRYHARLCQGRPIARRRGLSPHGVLELHAA